MVKITVPSFYPSKWLHKAIVIIFITLLVEIAFAIKIKKKISYHDWQLMSITRYCFIDWESLFKISFARFSLDVVFSNLFNGVGNDFYASVVFVFMIILDVSFVIIGLCLQLLVNWLAIVYRTIRNSIEL